MAVGSRQSKLWSTLVGVAILATAAALSLFGGFPSGATPADPVLVAALASLETPLIVSAYGTDSLDGIVDAVPSVRRLPPWEPLAADSAGAAVLARAGRRPPTAAGVELGAPARYGEWVLYAAAAPSAAAAEGSEESEEIALIERLSRAHVSIELADGTRRDCGPFAFGRFNCGPNDWNWVGRTDLTVRNRSETCIWAHPTDEGAILVEFDDLPASGLLRGRMALSDEAAGSDNDTPVDLVVERDGEELLRREHRIRQGFGSFRERIEPGDRDTMTLTFRISAEFVGQRHFCFVATLDPTDVLERDAEGSR